MTDEMFEAMASTHDVLFEAVKSLHEENELLREELKGAKAVPVGFSVSCTDATVRDPDLDGRVEGLLANVEGELKSRDDFATTAACIESCHVGEAYCDGHTCSSCIKERVRLQMRKFRNERMVG